MNDGWSEQLQYWGMRDWREKILIVVQNCIGLEGGLYI